MELRSPSSMPAFVPSETCGLIQRHHGRLMLTGMGGLAEFERELIRVRAGGLSYRVIASPIARLMGYPVRTAVAGDRWHRMSLNAQEQNEPDKQQTELYKAAFDVVVKKLAGSSQAERDAIIIATNEANKKSWTVCKEFYREIENLEKYSKEEIELVLKRGVEHVYSEILYSAVLDVTGTDEQMQLGAHALVNGLEQEQAAMIIEELLVYGPIFAKITDYIKKPSILRILLRKRSQNLAFDDYGNVKPREWKNDIDYFIEHELPKALSEDSYLDVTTNRLEECTQHIEDIVSEEMDVRENSNEFDRDMSPNEFEKFCASRLKRNGWETYVTKASGDQGADVIAERNSVRIVLQCKLYSSPVGNAAVQEVVAAKAHEKAHWAGVVTNSTYTESAKRLAKSNKVLLLHYADLDILNDLLGEPTSEQNRVTVDCPRCKTHLRLPPHRRGTVRCPECGVRFMTDTTSERK